MGKLAFINNVPPGQDITIPMSLKGFEPRSGGSGHVSPGRYKLQVVSLKVEAKKEGKSGNNIHLEAKVTEPAAQQGVPIHMWIGDDTKEGSEANFDKIRGLVFSCLSVSGKLEAARAVDQINPKLSQLVGQHFCVVLQDGTGDYANRSEVARSISVEEFSAQPGPDRSLPVSVASASPAQTSTPELLSGDAAPAGRVNDGKPAPAAIDNVLFQ
jgi:hypothetical protein